MDEVEEVRPLGSGDGSQKATLSRLLALGDPVRRRVYDLVARSTEPMSRDAVAAASDLSRSTAAFHLERLTTDGLLVTESRRLSGRTGPGAGRPAKLYRRADGEFAVSVPDRQYRLAGEVLATAIEESHETGERARDAVRRVAGQEGERLGRESPSLATALEAQGYEPRAEGSDVVMGNCPFHRLAEAHPSLVCELNVELLRGAARGAGEACRVDLDPGAGGCCIRISTE
jgi:predicted ArsR family transcriptional regulator